MTNLRYQSGCTEALQELGKPSAVWIVNFNNGNVNNNNRNNNACVRAVRASEYQGEQGVSLKHLHNAWKIARKGKKASRNQLAFDTHWADGLLDIQQQLNNSNWQPKKSACFIATSPKAREIHAPDFADRVVHHWLVPQLDAIWEPSFIHDSYANRKAKRTHRVIPIICPEFAHTVFHAPGAQILVSMLTATGWQCTQRDQLIERIMTGTAPHAAGGINCRPTWPIPSIALAQYQFAVVANLDIFSTRVITTQIRLQYKIS